MWKPVQLVRILLIVVFAVFPTVKAIRINIDGAYELNEAFPDGSFLNAVQNDIIIEWSNKIIVDLIKKNIIRPAMNYPYELLMKRAANSQKIDFTDFLVEIGYMGANERENLINRFDSNLDAEERIKQHT